MLWHHFSRLLWLAVSPPLQMVAVLLTGNGVAWLLFCSLWGSLPFR